MCLQNLCSRPFSWCMLTHQLGSLAQHVECVFSYLSNSRYVQMTSLLVTGDVSMPCTPGNTDLEVQHTPTAALECVDFEFKEGFFVQVTPDDASLLCALGDITLDDKHYQKAWDVSKGRSTRAQRSLARSAQRQQHWEEVGSFTCAVADNHSWRSSLSLFCNPSPIRRLKNANKEAVQS